METWTYFIIPDRRYIVARLRLSWLQFLQPHSCDLLRLKGERNDRS